MLKQYSFTAVLRLFLLFREKNKQIFLVQKVFCKKFSYIIVDDFKNKEVFDQCQTQNPIYGGIIDEVELHRNLEQNCIPTGFEEMEISDYNNFLEMRRKLMAEKIRNYYFSL